MHPDLTTFECRFCRRQLSIIYRAVPWVAAVAPADQCFECYIEKKYRILPPKRRHTPHWRELGEYLASGHTQADAAAHFGVSDRTIRNIIKHARQRGYRDG